MRRILSIILLGAVAATLSAAEYDVVSPDGKVQAKVVCDNGTKYSLSYNGRELIVDSPLSMTLSDGTVWGNAKVRKASLKSVNEPINATFYRNLIMVLIIWCFVPMMTDLPTDGSLIRGNLIR